MSSIPRHDADILSFTFVPRRDTIAFSSTRDGNAELYRINPGGTGLTRLTNHPAIDTTPAW